jgi:uncharacterized membrane protein
MNPAERLAFTITQVVVSNRQARWIFIAYLVGLHFLVISSMYQVMLTTDSHHGKCQVLKNSSISIGFFCGGLGYKYGNAKLFNLRDCIEMATNMAHNKDTLE